MSDSITHISDTAFWIAAFRAIETERDDAAFHDKLAGVLAGEKGRQIAEITPHKNAFGFAMTMRTSAIDRLIKKAIDLGVDTVINLAAGLDTRPYRLDLPPTLNWIEVDLPAITQYKNEKLKDEKPACKLQRIIADLSEPETRKNLFKTLSAETKKALIVTEGLIVYLTPEQARELSEDIYNTPNFNYWIQEYAQGSFRRNSQSSKLAKIVKQTPLKFNVKNPLEFFQEQGWKIKENTGILDEAQRVGRKMPAMFPWSNLMHLFPKLIYRIGNSTYGYVMFRK